MLLVALALPVTAALSSDVPPGSEARAINASGTIVGTVDNLAGEPQPAKWIDGRVTYLPGLPGATYGEATDINDDGVIVGNITSANAPGLSTRPVRWVDGEVLALPVAGADTTIAMGINDAGDIVGYAFGQSGVRAVRWSNCDITELPLGDAVGGAAEDINDAGQVVGWVETSDDRYSAAMWNGDALTLLGTLPGSEMSFASAINTSGQVVGSSGAADGSNAHAVLWEDENITELAPPLGYAGAAATDINDNGQVVGYVNMPTEGQTRAVMWNGGVATVLASDGESSSASGINDRGQVVGFVTTLGFARHVATWIDGRPTLLEDPRSPATPAGDPVGVFVAEGEYVSPQHGVTFEWDDAWYLDPSRPPASNPTSRYDDVHLLLSRADAVTLTAFAFPSDGRPLETIVAERSSEDALAVEYGLGTEVLYHGTEGDRGAIVLLRVEGAGPTIYVEEYRLVNDGDSVVRIVLRAPAQYLELGLAAAQNHAFLDGGDVMTFFTYEELRSMHDG
jgi:probable HAF family extracellular repeat protein